uniref:Uncharacterized protein n=1 Tax=Cacopsylla melanoneura TaxID=428564 RepID=A0A8D9AUX0_9HEMI
MSFLVVGGFLNTMFFKYPQKKKFRDVKSVSTVGTAPKTWRKKVQRKYEENSLNHLIWDTLFMIPWVVKYFYCKGLQNIKERKNWLVTDFVPFNKYFLYLFHK